MQDLEDRAPALGAWVPIGSVSCIQGLAPLQIQVFGYKFVVWKSGDTWSVLADECPHRFSPLSIGLMDPKTKCLECPLHGWQFSANGTLQSIPQLEKTAELRPDVRSVESYETLVTGDLLWAFLPTSFHGEAFPKSMLPLDYYKDLNDVIQQNATFYTQEMPFSFDFMVEK